MQQVILLYRSAINRDIEGRAGPRPGLGGGTTLFDGGRFFRTESPNEMLSPHRPRPDGGALGLAGPLPQCGGVCARGNVRHRDHATIRCSSGTASE